MSPYSIAGRAAVVAAIAVVAGCGPDCAPRPGETRPNVVLITIDTLRADHVGAYGGSAAKTPHLDRLAAEGMRFAQSWSVSHVTLPSHLSIMVSRPVLEHGVSTNHDPLQRRMRHLPGLLARAGWRTGAFVGSKHLGPGWALGDLVAEGFETFDVPRRLSEPRLAEETNARVAEWLGAVCGEPFFAWIHYWDPHTPYTAPEEYAREYYPGDPRAASHPGMDDVRLPWGAYDSSVMRRALFRHRAAMRAIKDRYALGSRQLRHLLENPVDLARLAPDAASATDLRASLLALSRAVRAELPLRRPGYVFLDGVRDVRFPIAQYAAEVAYTDTAIGELRATLERLGVAERTVVVVTADHGESLGEHGLYFAHMGLMEPNVRVPFVVWAPDRVAPGVYEPAVSGLDVAPTILGLAGQPVPASMRGRDLLADDVPEAPVVTESMKGHQRAIAVGDWKLIATERAFWYADGFERAAGDRELYDLGRDAGELDDLSGEHGDVAAELEARLDDWVVAHAADAGPVDLPPLPREHVEGLRMLGYVE